MLFKNDIFTYLRTDLLLEGEVNLSGVDVAMARCRVRITDRMLIARPLARYAAPVGSAISQSLTTTSAAVSRVMGSILRLPSVTEFFNKRGKCRRRVPTLYTAVRPSVQLPSVSEIDTG